MYISESFCLVTGKKSWYEYPTLCCLMEMSMIK